MRKRRRNKRGLQSKKGETVTGRLGDKEGVRIIKKNPHEWCSTKKKKGTFCISTLNYWYQWSNFIYKDCHGPSLTIWIG